MNDMDSTIRSPLKSFGKGGNGFEALIAATDALSSALDPDCERLLENRERLLGPGLIEIRRRRPDDLSHRNARRRVDRQLRGNECLVARLVRLRVEAIRKRDFERRPRGLAGTNAAPFDERRHLCARSAHLRFARRAKDTKERTEDTKKERRSGNQRRSVASGAAGHGLFDVDR